MGNKQSQAKYFIAVVVKQTFGSPKAGVGESGRPLGDWASFVADTEEAAIAQALNAKREWEARSSFPSQSYRILVGELNAEIRPVTYYTIGHIR